MADGVFLNPTTGAAGFSGGAVTNPVQGPNGTAANPTYTNSTGTAGLYFPTATTPAISSNGLQALSFDTSQNATFANNVRAVNFNVTNYQQTQISNLGVLMSGMVRYPVTASTALTVAASQGGMVDMAGTAASQTLTLGAALPGAFMFLGNRSTQTWTISSGSSATITGSTLTGTSRTMNAGSQMILGCIDGTNWYIFSIVGTVG